MATRVTESDLLDALAADARTAVPRVPPGEGWIRGPDLVKQMGMPERTFCRRAALLVASGEWETWQVARNTGRWYRKREPSR